MNHTNNQQRKATDLKIGESSVIQEFGNEEMSSKFLEIGCLPKAPIQLVRKDPSGNTMYVKINGCSYALRNEEAAHIILKY